VLWEVVMVKMATNDGKNVSTTHFLEFKNSLHCS
ncbi:MAG: hypothetical protein ACI8RD_012079, partial [Bacillariaceae sp.]